MTTSDLHPEEMLDAARRGQLGPHAAADLGAHLQRCPACRLSLSLVDDLRVEGAVTGADQALLSGMVAAAMAGQAQGRGAARGRPASGLTLRRAALGLVLLLAGGSAGAAVWSVSREGLARRLRRQVVELPHAPSAPRPVARVALEPLPPRLAPAPRLAAHATPAHLSRPAAAPLSADELFADANRARRSGEYQAALRLYRQLRRQFPGSRQEMTARVIVGDLTMAEGALAEALASFDSYLAANPDGTLAEEARVGRALALMRLGSRDEEREAWTQLLARHPHSVQGARARARLAELR